MLTAGAPEVRMPREDFCGRIFHPEEFVNCFDDEELVNCE